MAACTVSFLLWTVSLQWTLAQDYSSQWAAHIQGGLEIAKRTTEKHGFVLLGEVNNLIIFYYSIAMTFNRYISVKNVIQNILIQTIQ